jgi:hypothetical protein
MLISGPIPLLALVFYTLGVSARDSGVMALGISIQGFLGGYLWLLLRRGTPGLLELVGMGLVLGTSFSMLSGVLLRSILPWTASWGLLLFVTLGLWSLRIIRTRSATRSEQAFHPDLKGSLVAASGLVIGLALIWLNLRRYPLHWNGIWDQYHGDMIFFEALSNSVAKFGANDSIFMLGADIRYHWFAYAWAGQMTESLGIAPFAVLTRALPVVSLLISVTLVITLVRHMMTEQSLGKLAPLVPWLAVLLLLTGGYVAAVNGTILNFDSPSQSLSAGWLLGFVLALFMYFREKGRAVCLLILVSVLAGVLTGSKISTGAVAIGAIFVVALAGTFLRSKWAIRAWCALIGSAIISGFVYLTVIAGSASPGDLQFFTQNARASTLQGLNSSETLRGIVLGTAALTLAISARWVGSVWLVTDRQWRSRPESWFGVGMVVMSLIPLWIFSQGLNETWFALAASGPLSALCAVGLYVGWQRIDASLAFLVYSAAAALVSVILVSFIWTNQILESGFGRFYAPYLAYVLAVSLGFILMLFHSRKGLVTVVVAASTILVLQASVARISPIFDALYGGPKSGVVVSANELEGISIQNEDSEESSDMAGTLEYDINISPTGSVRKEPQERSSWSQLDADAAQYLKSVAAPEDVVLTNETLSYLVPALTGLRTFISGAQYQEIYGSPVFAEEVPARISRTRAFMSTPNTSEAEEFYVMGVRWVWASTELNPEIALSGMGELVFANESVKVFKLLGLEK